MGDLLSKIWGISVDVRLSKKLLFIDYPLRLCLGFILYWMRREFYCSQGLNVFYASKSGFTVLTTQKINKIDREQLAAVEG